MIREVAMKRCLVIFALVLGLPHRASAHHPAVSRVVTAGARPDAALDGAELPRLDVGLDALVARFNRALDGDAVYRDGDFGDVFVALSSPSVTLELNWGLGIGAVVPAGVSTRTSPEGTSDSVMGLGDAQVFVQQRLTPASTWALVSRLSLVLPTGEYDPGRNLSIAEISGGTDGSLDVISHDSRTSLGSGVFALSPTVSTAFSVSAAALIELEIGALVPVTTTRDDLRWGEDLFASLGPRVLLLDGTFSLRPALEGLVHIADTVSHHDEATGEPFARTSGGRRELGVALELAIRPSRGLSCSLEPMAPVYQYVEGIQLVSSFSVRAGCTLALPL